MDIRDIEGLEDAITAADQATDTISRLTGAASRESGIAHGRIAELSRLASCACRTYTMVREVYALARDGK